MFEPHELKAMAIGYGVVIPLLLVALYLGSPPAPTAAALGMLGFCITLVFLSRG